MQTGKMYSLFGKNGIEEIPEMPTLKEGTQIIHVGAGLSETRAAVLKTDDSHIWVITLTDTPSLSKKSKADYIRPISKRHGIGTYYYDDLRTINMVEVNAAYDLYNQQQEANKLRQDHEALATAEAAKIGRVLIEDNMPAGTIGLICAHEKKDASDPMSDYFSNEVTRTVIIGYTSKSKEDFREMRDAARTSGISELIEISDMPYEMVEHRDKYSGGHGYWLGKSRHHGWEVKKHIFSDYTPVKNYYKHAGKEGGFTAYKCKAVAPIAATTPATGTGATISFNVAKGGIEIKFPGKPSESILKDLRECSPFRWSRFAKVWWAKDTATNRAFAAQYGTLPTGAAPQEEVNNDFDNMIADQQWDAIK